MSREIEGRANILGEAIKEARLTWRLLLDRRVSPWMKMVLPATMLYILSPLDFLPDPILGLGQLDDLAILIMGVKLFIELCPQEIVREHRDRLASLTASYREAKEEGEERSSPHLIEGPREVLGKSKGV